MSKSSHVTANLLYYAPIQSLQKNDVMIKKVRIKNFKCYGPQGADFNLSKINFIFGDNSAGKSTFLQFLDKINDVCNLEGRCDSKILDKYLFKHQDGVISAKLRVLTEGSTVPVEDVWSFQKSDRGSDEYQLTDSKGSFIGLDQLRKVLPAKKPIAHVVANRKSVANKSHVEVSKLAEFQKDAERLVGEDNLSSMRDGVNDILNRLGIPYSCVVAISEGVASVSRGMIHDNDFDMDLRLSEVGTGIEGLIELAMTLNAWEGGLLALEEPETNVNEAQLASLMNVLVAEAKKRTRGQLFVECHSELMFLEMRNILKHEILSPDDISIIVVQKSTNGSMTTQIPLDRFGNILKPWPGGLFPERINITDAYYK